MLDSRSLEIISKFKLALLTRAQQPDPAPSLPVSNRGKKLSQIGTKSHALTPKVVEYGGLNHLVLTNDLIERTNYRNKRRWLDFYLSQHGRVEDTSSGPLTSESEEEDDDSDQFEEENGHPLKKLRLSEILAPLAHPSEIVTHPAISKTYKLTCLSTLALELIDLIEVEQGTLNHLNKLLQVLDGEDWLYLLEENMGLPVYDHGLDESITALQKQIKETEEAEKAKREAENAHGANGLSGTAGEADDNKRITRLSTAAPDGQVQVTDPFFALPKTLAMYEESQQKQMDAEEDADELEAVQQDLVSYLLVSIQRQFEYIKNLTTLRNGIVKVDRYRNDLYKWGKEMNEKKN